MKTIPELEPHCGSWIATREHPDAPPRLAETFERATAQALADAGWQVETAAQYLGRFNQAVKVAARNRAAIASFDAEFGIKRKS